MKISLVVLIIIVIAILIAMVNLNLMPKNTIEPIIQNITNNSVVEANSVSATIYQGNIATLSLGGNSYTFEINKTTTQAVVFDVNGVRIASLGMGGTYPLDDKTILQVDRVRISGGYPVVDITLKKK